jgi:hypothetical protein
MFTIRYLTCVPVRTYWILVRNETTVLNLYGGYFRDRAKENGGPLTQEKLWENEKLMREMSLTWQEKLHKTEQLQVVFTQQTKINVADPGCFSRIRIFHLGSRVKKIPDSESGSA